jgi:hypothetical protein
MSSGKKNLTFLAVGRIEDEKTLATYRPDSFGGEDPANSPEVVFGKLLKAAKKKLRKGEKTQLQWNDGSVCCMLDMNGELLYCVVTSQLSYPAKLAYGVLQDLQRQVASLSSSGDFEANVKPRMQDILVRYEDEKKWKELEQALTVVNTAQQNLSDTKAQHAGQSKAVTEMAESSQKLQSSANQLQSRGNDYIEQQNAQYRKSSQRRLVMILLALVFLCSIFAAGWKMFSSTSSPEANEDRQSLASRAYLRTAVRRLTWTEPKTKFRDEVSI